MERSASRFISALTMESIINHISVLNPQRILKEMEGILNQLRNTLAIAPNRRDTTLSDPLLLYGRAYRD